MRYASDLSIKEQNNTLHQIYLRYSWGARTDTELASEAMRLIQKAEQYGFRDKVDAAVALGIQADGLSGHLRALLEAEGTGAAQSWLSEHHDQHDPWIRKSLSTVLEKWQARHERAQRGQQYKVCHSSIMPVQFSTIHPNSIQHLSTDSNWTVYIDESGKYFDAGINEQFKDRPELGRIVALVVPGRTELHHFSDGFHATDATPSEIDEHMQYLLDQDIGIFGFTVNDPMAYAGNWFSHVVLLARWVLFQLPMAPDIPTQVSFYIERNDARLAYQKIDSLANLLEGEVKAIDANRFAQLHISAELMDKKHPLNGYVDLVAFTWGSPAAHSRDRLKKSALLGHCLLQPDQQSMQRLYLSATRNEQLPAKDWYTLCSQVAHEHKSGFLNYFLAQLGEKAQKNLRLWQYYLEEVREQLRHPHHKLAEVCHALDWLERYAPEHQELPSIYRLPLETARLGQENHQGKVNLRRLETCLELITQLEEEDAQQACGALLRVAVSGSNSFEFTLLQPMIQQWLAKPIAISGLANYARLHSSMGQIHAFCHQHSEALEHFERALNYFDRLSDPQRARREKQQTDAYRLTVLMDSNTHAIRDLLNELSQGLDWQDYSRQMAASGQNLRYAHHLWLRALVFFPKKTKEARQSYLNQSHLWQIMGDHPWGLIAAYRGWLLHMQGKALEAGVHMDMAIDLCANPDNGPVLRWMAEVLRTLAKALDIPVQKLPSAEERAHLQDILPAAPHKALQAFALADASTNHEVRIALQQCLPFNFH